MNDLNKILKAQKKNKKLMVIFPHPDDEAVMTGGLLLFARKFGWETIVVTLTKGGAGQCHTYKNGRSLTKVRTEELEKAVKALNVSKLILGDFRDANLKEDSDKLKIGLLEIILNENPSIVITYDHSGFTGHPDHISLSVVLLEVIKKIKKPIDLYWVSVPSLISKIIVNQKTLKYFILPTHRLSIGFDWIRKFMTVMKHRSQNVLTGNILLFLYLAIFTSEWYYKVDLNRKYKHRFVYFKI